jgi:hypothetical protein
MNSDIVSRITVFYHRAESEQSSLHVCILSTYHCRKHRLYFPKFVQVCIRSGSLVQKMYVQARSNGRNSPMSVTQSPAEIDASGVPFAAKRRESRRHRARMENRRFARRCLVVLAVVCEPVSVVACGTGKKEGKSPESGARVPRRSVFRLPLP